MPRAIPLAVSCNHWAGVGYVIYILIHVPFQSPRGPSCRPCRTVPWQRHSPRTDPIWSWASLRKRASEVMFLRYPDLSLISEDIRESFVVVTVGSILEVQWRDGWRRKSNRAVARREVKVMPRGQFFGNDFPSPGTIFPHPPTPIVKRTYYLQYHRLFCTWSQPTRLKRCSPLLQPSLMQLTEFKKTFTPRTTLYCVCQKYLLPTPWTSPGLYTNKIHCVAGNQKSSSKFHFPTNMQTSPRSPWPNPDRVVLLEQWVLVRKSLRGDSPRKSELSEKGAPGKYWNLSGEVTGGCRGLSTNC